MLTILSPVARTSAARRSRLPVMVSSSSAVGSTQIFSGSSLSSAACPRPTTGTGPISGAGASPGFAGTPSNSRVNPCSPRSSPVACGSSGSRNAVTGGIRRLGWSERQHHGDAGELGRRLCGWGREGATLPVRRRSSARSRRSTLALGGEPAAERTDHRPVRKSVAMITPRKATTMSVAPAPAPPSTRSTPDPIQRPRAPASAGRSSRSPPAARPWRRHSRARRACPPATRGSCRAARPVSVSPATPIHAPTPNAPKSPSCTGPAIAPSTGQDEHRREDDARSDRPDPGQLTAKVAMQQRGARR